MDEEKKVKENVERGRGRGSLRARVARERGSRRAREKELKLKREIS